MIGKLHITEQTVAVLNEDGVWECPHAGYEAELNALHYPRPESPDILLPFGHMALHNAAAAYRGSYELTNGAVPILDLVPPRRPITSEVVTDLRDELARQEASGEISPEDAAEAKRLLEGAASESLAASTKRFRTYLWRRKAIVQKPSGRWWDDERNVWAKNPNAEPRKVGSRKKKPKDSSNKPVPQSYNTDGEEPSSNTSGGKKVGKPKATKQKKEPASAVAPDGRIVNPKFERVDRAVSMLREGMGVGPDADLAISALADMQEEGTEIPGADFNIRERVAADDGFARGAARQILENVAAEAGRRKWDRAGIQYADIARDLERRTGGSYALLWHDEDSYRLGRALEALGWDVAWRGKGAPNPEGEMQTVWPDLSGSGNLFARVVRPKGSVPLATDQYGAVWTAVEPSREAYQRLSPVLARAARTLLESDRLQSGAYIPSHLFMREVMRLAPEESPADVWAAFLVLERGEATLVRPPRETEGSIHELREAAGLPEEDANLWRRGGRMTLNVPIIIANALD